MAPQRLHALDNLRALAMLAGVLFHALLAHSPLARPYWPAADTGNAPLVDLLIWWLHLFRMPLFFLIAGYFAAQAVQRHGLAGMLRSRWRRIALPLLLLGPLLLGLMTLATGWALRHVEQPSPLLRWIRQVIADGIELPAPGIAHLWFLYYLLLFALLVWVARQLVPPAWSAALRRLGPIPLLLGLPPLLALPMLSVTAPHPAPESWLPQLWALAHYGLFFALGYLMQGSDLLARCARWLPAFGLGSVVAYAIYLGLLGKPSWHPLAALAGSGVALWTSLACLLLAQRWLDRAQGLLRYLTQAAYWTYLLHLPVLLALQYALLDVDWVWPLKLALALGLTLAVCLASYQLLVRHTPLRRYLG